MGKSGTKTGTRRKGPAGVRKHATGIVGFDEMLEGGVPAGRALLVAGGSGAGKTVLMCEFLYRGIDSFGERGVLVTFEEQPEDIIRNVAGFGWDFAGLIKAGKLAIVDASPVQGGERELGEDYDLEPLLIRIRQAVKRLRARRLVLDSLESLFARLSNSYQVRELLYRIAWEAKQLGVTTMISAEKLSASGMRHGVEDFVADGVVELSAEPGQQSTLRRIVVRKLRGVGYRSGNVEFRITGHGIKVFPKLKIDRHYRGSSSANRKRFGITRLDEILGGGIPEGYLVLVSGNTGTGKSIFAQQFLAAGIRAGEPGVYVAMEEPSGQVRSIARGRGMNFAAWERQRKLAILDVSLIDVCADEVLHRIVEAVEALGARRVVLDSVSSLRSATMDSEKVRQFMIQLGEYAKAKRLTFILTYLANDAFGAEKGQLLSTINPSDVRLSTVVDGVIIQRYVERAQQVSRLLHVLKLRGSVHDRAIFSYAIEDKRVVIGDKFES